MKYEKLKHETCPRGDPPLGEIRNRYVTAKGRPGSYIRVLDCLTGTGERPKSPNGRGMAGKRRLGCSNWNKNEDLKHET